MNPLWKGLNTKIFLKLHVMKTKVAILLLFILAITALCAPFSASISHAQTSDLEINEYGWVDEVVFFPEKDRAKAVDMLKKGDMHVYFIDISDPMLFKTIKESEELTYDVSYGLYYELTFNPYGPVFKNGELNPFNDTRIREAMNYLVDRNYIVDEIMGGLGSPKYTCVVKALPEGQRYLDVLDDIEEKYSYDFDKAKAIITEEMEKLGATLVDGKWYYNGKPVVIKFIIRTEDARKQIGDYVANQLEKLGFTVERMYKTSREASPLWIGGNPADGQWHIYTGGWITTAVTRDDSDNFQFFYTQDSVMSFSPLWRSYTPNATFREVARKLANKEFSSMEERNQLMREAFYMAMKDSVRVWLVDQVSIWVKRAEVEAVADYAGGFPVRAWPYTIRFKDKVGGTLKIGSSDVAVDPWNPVAPSDWVYDVAVYQAAMDFAFITHPKTGLPIPINVESVTVEVQKGLPVYRNPESKDWLTFSYVDKVTVPPDAWYAWDVKNKRMITAGEAGVTTAKAKVVINYGDIAGKPYYHDGSPKSIADWLIDFIIRFERADSSSPLFDESWVAPFASWRNQFVAWRIVSEKPLIIEYYTNYTTLDAELVAMYAYGGVELWPSIPWHVYAIGILAEEEGKLAFSASKAEAKNVEWMNYVGGPSLEILKAELDKAAETGYIPFKELLGKYVTEEEAKARYANLQRFYKEHGHFWVGDGPYYVDRVDITAHTATLKSFRTLAAMYGRGEVSLPAVTELILGMPVKLSGKFVDSVTGLPYANLKLDVLMSKDGGKTWTKIDETSTDQYGMFQYIAIPDAPGTYMYKLYFPGSEKIPELSSSPISVTVKSLSDVLAPQFSKISSDINSLISENQKLKDEISALRAQLSTVMLTAVIAIIIAIILGAAAIYIGRKR